MQKTSFLCLAAVCVAGIARVHAQNVGIGTLHPQQKLHVAGGLRVDTLSNGKDSGLLRHNADGTVFSLTFTGDSSQVLRGNGSFGPAVTAASGTVTPFGLVTNPWLLGGNAGVTPATNFLGTTDNAALRFRINNQWAGMLDSVSQSSFFGYGAGKNDTAVAAGNTAMGYQALNVNTTGSFNSGLGVRALAANVSGNYNTAMGWLALAANTSGAQNTALGVQALQSNTTGGNNVAVGLNSMNVNSSGTDNTAVGVQALNFNSSGVYNTALGRSALFANSTGKDNTGAGHLALSLNTTGQNNVAIGAYVLRNCGNCTETVAIGDSAIYTQTQFSTPLQTGFANTAIGSKALFSNTTGAFNTVVGYQSLTSNTTGGDNVAVGPAVLTQNVNGFSNIALGVVAMSNNVSGSQNVAIGPGALATSVTSFDNTALGGGADIATDGLFNVTSLGFLAVGSTSNTVQLGDPAVTAVNSFGSYHTISDGRFKFNIQEDVKGLDFILRLRPVSYQLDVRQVDAHLRGGMTRSAATGVNSSAPGANAREASFTAAAAMRRTGFIAQEVEKAAQECGYDFVGVVRPQNDRDNYSLNYQAFIMPVVKAVQEQQKEIEDLKRMVAEQRKMIDELLHK